MLLTLFLTWMKQTKSRKLTLSAYISVNTEYRGMCITLYFVCSNFDYIQRASSSMVKVGICETGQLGWPSLKCHLNSPNNKPSFRVVTNNDAVTSIYVLNTLLLSFLASLRSSQFECPKFAIGITHPRHQWSDGSRVLSSNLFQPA